MNKKKPFVYKRVIAYFMDLLAVTLISGILSIMFINNSAYNEDSKKVVELTKQLTEGEITQDEYYVQFDDLNYNLTKDSVGVTAITCAVALIYYVVLCYYCHGVTLGKYIMKIKITSANEKKLNLGNYFLRCLIINMVLSNILSIVMVELLNKQSFISIYSKVSNVFTILLVLSFILVMYRDDGRGIEDFMGNTKVINFKDEVVKDNIEEATIVEEKKNNRKKG